MSISESRWLVRNGYAATNEWTCKGGRKFCIVRKSNGRRGACPLSERLYYLIQNRVGALASIWVVPQKCFQTFVPIRRTEVFFVVSEKEIRGR